MRLRIGRPTGRIFFAWLILVVAVLAGATSQATTSETLIVDVLYRADGTPAQGTLLISWPAFSTAGGDAIAAGSMKVNLGTNGSLQVAVFPNTGSTPRGTFYRVLLDLDDGTRSTEYWVVPQVAQTTIAAVRSLIVPQAQAMQFVGRDYVDSAIANAVGSSVELTGAQTIAGVKTFENSPQVPTPANPGDAANRQFVLDTVSASGQATAQAQTTPSTVNATQFEINGIALSSGNLSDGATLAKISQIPTQTSQLTNNSGFIAAAQAPVQSVNGMTGAVNLGSVATATTATNVNGGSVNATTGSFSGSVTVSSTLQAQEAITISDPRYYGAKCDWNGTTGTDDTAAMQTAINTIGSGDLIFPANHRCMISASLYLLYPNNQGMRIKGSPQLSKAPPTSGLVVNPLASAPFIPLILAGGAVNIDGLEIDGVSSSTGKASAGLLCWYCMRGKIYQTTATNIAGDGFVLNDGYFTATNTTAITSTGLQTITLIGLPFPLYAGEGISVVFEPGSANSEQLSMRAVGTYSAGTQTVTVSTSKLHTAPATVELLGNNNGLIFDHDFSTYNAGWGYNMPDDLSAGGQNDVRFDKVHALSNGSGGIWVHGSYVNGTIQGGSFQSNTGYAVELGDPAGTSTVQGWNIYGPDDNESNTQNCIYEARASRTNYHGDLSAVSLCPPTLTRTIANLNTSQVINGSTIGPQLFITPAGNSLQFEMNANLNRGTALWPANINTLVQPTWPALTVTGGVIATGTVTPTNGGANWVRTPTCSITDTGSGAGASCTATVDYAASLTVTSVNISNGGSGYSSPSIVLTGGQDMALSLHSRGAQPIRLNMYISGQALTGSTGGTIFGDGTINTLTYPVARVDNLGCISYSEANSENQKGKFCQTFAGNNTYTMPDATGTNTWSMVGLQSGQTRPTIAGTSTQVALLSDVTVAPGSIVATRSYCASGCTAGVLSGNANGVTLWAVPANGAGVYRAQCYLIITQAATTSSTAPYCSVAYTDAWTGYAGNYAVLTGTYTGNAVNHAVYGTPYVFNAAANTNIIFSTSGYASSGTTPMQYGAVVKLEYLGSD
jgi:hypothetical protein